MALHITKAADPILVERLVLCIYGGPGLGKTSLAFTADKPLLMDFDNGVYRAINRGDAVRIRSWADVAALEASDLSGYSTAVVDTSGRALDHLSDVLIKDDPKNRTKAGALSLQGYGALKTSFTQWLNRLKKMGLDVVLLAHMDEQRKGDDLIERLDIQGGSKNEIYKSADAMGRIFVDNGTRRLAFSPTDVAHGKNPGRLEILAVPDFSDGKNPHFLGEVIAQIKAVLNAESEGARVRREELEAMRARFLKWKKPEKFTAEAVALAAAGADDVEKRLLITVAKEKGFTWNKDGNGFVAPPKPDAKKDDAKTTDEPAATEAD